MFTLLFPAPGLLYMFTFGNHYKPMAPVAACYAWNAFNEVSMRQFHHMNLSLSSAFPFFFSSSQKTFLSFFHFSVSTSYISHSIHMADVSISNSKVNMIYVYLFCEYSFVEQVSKIKKSFSISHMLSDSFLFRCYIKLSCEYVPSRFYATLQYVFRSCRTNIWMPFISETEENYS